MRARVGFSLEALVAVGELRGGEACLCCGCSRCVACYESEEDTLATLGLANKVDTGLRSESANNRIGVTRSGTKTSQPNHLFMCWQFGDSRTLGSKLSLTSWISQ